MNLIQITQTLKIFGTIGLIFITGIASFTDENSFETSQCATPIAYNISLKIQNTHIIVISHVDINFMCTQQYMKFYIRRSCDIQTLQVKPNVSNFFPSQWATRRIVKLYFTNSRFKRVDISVIEQNHTAFDAKDTNTEQIITLHKGRKLTPGRYSMYSTHSCHLEDVATVSTYIRKLKHQTEYKEFLISTRIPAEWIFPYWKNPATTAKFIIHIEHKNTEYALSNIGATTIYRTKTMVSTGFNITFPISTHLVAAAIVPMSYNAHISVKNKSIDDINIKSSVQAIKDILYAQSLIHDITRIMRNLWNNILPRSRYVTYLIFPVNLTNYKMIVTTGLVVFSEADVIYDDNVDSIIKKRKVTCLIARTVIQEMFSDRLVTLKQSDFWFEDFLTLYGMYIHDKYYRTTLLKSSVVQTRRIFFDYSEALMQYDLSIQDTLLISLKSTLSKLWQEKAFSTSYMFDTIFDIDLLYTFMFEKAVNLYYNTTSNDRNSEQQLILDHFWIIMVWKAKVGYPVVQVIQDNSTRDVDIKVTDCFDDDKTEPCWKKWWIPISLYKVTTTDITFIYQYFLRPYTNYSQQVLPKFKENEFPILMNGSGYRVNYDRQSWRNIALFLKNTKITHAKVPDVTLAQILDDAFYFLVQNTRYNDRSASNDSDVDIYFDIASGVLRVDTSYIAWYPLLSALENLSKNFLYPESVISRHIKDRTLAILNKFLDDISELFDIYSSENSVSNQLYYEVLKWTCILGSLKCNDYISSIIELHFKDPENNKLLLSWQKWIYCQGLMIDNVTYDSSVIWTTLIHIYMEQLKELFEFLPCSRLNSNIKISISACINFFLPSHGSLFNETESDTVTILFNMVAKHSKNVESLPSVLYIVEAIGERRNINIVAIISCIINNIYSDKGLLMVTNEKFLEKLMDLHRMPLFVLDAITEKAKRRRNFLVKMRFM